MCLDEHRTVPMEYYVSKVDPAALTVCRRLTAEISSRGICFPHHIPSKSISCAFTWTQDTILNFEHHQSFPFMLCDDCLAICMIQRLVFFD
jgi:hypothetical protein